MIKLEDYDPKRDGGRSWVGFDLDGTLAYHEGYKGRLHIGAPIPATVAMVKHLLGRGGTVKIVTARMAPPEWVDDVHVSHVLGAIIQWCETHIGQELEVVCAKDKDMFCLVDDRAIQVEKNTGRLCKDTVDYVTVTDEEFVELLHRCNEKYGNALRALADM